VGWDIHQVRKRSWAWVGMKATFQVLPTDGTQLLLAPYLCSSCVVLDSLTNWWAWWSEFDVFGMFLQCILHSMLNKTTENMWHAWVRHFVVGSRYLIRMAWWPKRKSTWGVVPSSFMKVILCSTSVSGEKNHFWPFAEAVSGRECFTPVPTNPSAKAYRRFFFKKNLGKVTNNVLWKTWAKISAKFQTCLQFIFRV
jgi:hypothetical protein